VVRGLLLGAKALKKTELDPTEAQAKKHRDALKNEADRLLAPGRADSPTEIEDKFRRRPMKQRGHLFVFTDRFVFLDHESVPATNNPAERQLRPAVVRRKLSCGHRTPRGAEAFEPMGV